MKTRTLFVAALLLAAAAAHAQTPVDAPAPVVQFGLFMIQPDGSVGGSAKQIGQQAGADLSRTFYLGTCSYGAGPVPASATDVWQLSGKVLAINAGEASVQIGWQRLRRAGQDESSSSESRSLTLKRGTRLTLERNALPPGSCGEGHVLLEIAFTDRSDRGREGNATDRAIEQARQRLEAVARPARNVPNDSTGTADLWLVRSGSQRPDDTLHTTIPFGSESQAFAFAPLSIPMTAGTLHVKVAGTLQVTRVPGPQWIVSFAAHRETTFVPANRPARDPAPQLEGSENTTLRLPTLEDVLSFELPPLRMPNGAILVPSMSAAEGALVSNSMSIRVRLTPAPGMTPKKK